MNASLAAADGACSPALPTCAARKQPGSGRADGKRSRGAKALPHGRRLKGPARYDMNTPAVPGIPCLAQMEAGASLTEVQRSIFAGYLHLQHASRAEIGRLQRWR